MKKILIAVTALFALAACEPQVSTVAEVFQPAATPAADPVVSPDQVPAECQPLPLSALDGARFYVESTSWGLWEDPSGAVLGFASASGAGRFLVWPTMQCAANYGTP